MYRVQTDAHLNTHTHTHVNTQPHSYSCQTHLDLLAYFQIFRGFKTILISKAIREGYKDRRKQNGAKRKYFLELKRDTGGSLDPYV